MILIIKSLNNEENMNRLLLRTQRLATTLTLASFFALGLQAQQKYTVKGSVVDEAGEPIIGATVMEGSSSNGTVTDMDTSVWLRRR